MHSTSWQTKLGLAVARFSLSAWIGAAVLFVVVGVREVTTPEFTSEIKDRLVTLRFPAYYITGATLIAVATVATVLASLTSQSRGLRLLLIGLVLAGAVMAIDYVWIYSPLAEMVTPPGQPRTLGFVSLHHWSMRINTIHLLVCMAVAIGLFAVDRQPTASKMGPCSDSPS